MRDRKGKILKKLIKENCIKRSDYQKLIDLALEENEKEISEIAKESIQKLNNFNSREVSYIIERLKLISNNYF
ncbi:hypothetical protein TAMYLO_600002 [Tenacibaculum amylolyticum]